MKLDPTTINLFARESEFQADNIEKVVRLRQVLIELHKHPFLRGKLALKGGSAINLFYMGLPRLSVDIDLNYIHHVSRDEMLKERPGVRKAVEQIAAGLGYRIQSGVDEHALKEWHLNYPDQSGKPDRIQVEINYVMRACALPPKILTAPAMGDSRPCEFLILAVEELFGGKIKAMIDRRHPRDLYDLYRFHESRPSHDPEILRKLAILFGSTMDRDFRTYAIDRIREINGEDIERHLYPLLKASDRPTLSKMLMDAMPILEPIFDHKREEPYLAAIAEGSYRPELLFPKHPEIVARIREHPALLWKAQNVREFLVKSKKRS